MKFLDVFRPGANSPAPQGRYSFNEWANDKLSSFLFGGHQYAVNGYTTTYGKQPAEPIGNDFAGYVNGGLKGNGVISALELVRFSVFSEARFQFQSLERGRPGKLFGTPGLEILERPWVGGTTGDLTSRMILDADFAGNNYNAHLNDELVRLRPDWVDILLAPRVGPWGRDSEDVTVGYERVGYFYYEGGKGQGGTPAFFLTSEVAHFAPYPDPLATYRGMSWLTPVIREIQADAAATTHKLKFFENGATPNLVVKSPKEVSKAQFDEFMEMLDARHKGVVNAYRTLYLSPGADVTVVGADMKQLDFKVTQGAGETRLAAAAGVHPVIAGLSEGMQGSSLNAGNFGAARRRFADGTMRPLWRSAAGSLEVLVPPPAGSRLWYDARDVGFLREDEKDAAEIQQTLASTIRSLVDAGYTPESVTAAVEADDRSLLVHSGLYSVQLQPAGTTPAVPTQAVP